MVWPTRKTPPTPRMMIRAKAASSFQKSLSCLYPTYRSASEGGILAALTAG
jgi:hypothetical protein